jgi:hypothetical protein
MKFSIVSIVACLASSALAAANAFTSPGPTDVLQAGSTFVISWNNTDGGSEINLFLKQGDPNNLATVLTIAQSLANGGAVRWSIPASLPAGNNYALEIQEVADTTIINFSNQFTIQGDANFTSSAAPSSTAISSSTAANTSTSIAPTTTPLAANSSIASSIFANSTSAGRSTVTTIVCCSQTSAGLPTKSVATVAASSSAAAAAYISFDTLAIVGGLGAALLAL